MSGAPSPARAPIVLAPGVGRAYQMPTMRAVFKADGAETRNRYSVSEWWLEPFGAGPGPHSHDENDELFCVMEGTASLLIGENWVEAARGSFLMIPAGTVHDFANRTAEPVGLLNVFIPGGFEAQMPAILDWYERQEGA